MQSSSDFGPFDDLPSLSGLSSCSLLSETDSMKDSKRERERERDERVRFQVRASVFSSSFLRNIYKHELNFE